MISMGILGVDFSSALLFAPWRIIGRRDTRLIKLPRLLNGGDDKRIQELLVNAFLLPL